MQLRVDLRLERAPDGVLHLGRLDANPTPTHSNVERRVGERRDPFVAQLDHVVARRLVDGLELADLAVAQVARLADLALGGLAQLGELGLEAVALALVRGLLGLVGLLEVEDDLDVLLLALGHLLGALGHGRHLAAELGVLGGLGLELDLEVLALALEAAADLVEQVVDLGQRGEERVLGREEVVDLFGGGGGGERLVSE